MIRSRFKRNLEYKARRVCPVSGRKGAQLYRNRRRRSRYGTPAARDPALKSLSPGVRFSSFIECWIRWGGRIRVLGHGQKHIRSIILFEMLWYFPIRSLFSKERLISFVSVRGKAKISHSRAIIPIQYFFFGS